ncbi:CAF17-like 4Fe-4S cluster assembly/insertion protein YgfZ [Dokdonella sp. MW10]|uniref:CAF17-like 4Fe-4S cluster assembly/insertion protein YgfZ n=1 Tax=Dokdonella sp. MW10 TaxID=2992926 RepID=UPI003F7FDAC2
MIDTFSPPAHLGPATLVGLEGRDAVAFAHAQFTSDVAALTPGAWQWSAWLDAQGRARAVFALMQLAPERLVAWLPRGDGAAFAAELRRFVFRSKVTIAPIEDFALLDDGAARVPAGIVAAEQDGWAIALPGRGGRTALLARATTPAREDVDAAASWALADVQAGLPWIDGTTAGTLVAAALDLARLGAVSYDKGCYPGQEIVARLHFRGGNKRHPFLLVIDGAPPAPGTTIIDAGITGTHGVVLHAAASGTGSEALAVLPDALADATGLRVEATGAVAQRRAFAAPNLALP